MLNQWLSRMQPEVFCSTVGGRVVSQGDVDVVATVVAYLNQGKIVALKSIGGYHLLCDAQSTDRPFTPA